MCGEKFAVVVIFHHFQGSPPRVRGKVGQAANAAAAERITPACAGKRNLHEEDNLRRQDHPRVCGEKCHLDAMLCSSFRITPACAGKRLWFLSKQSNTKDHPRVCGEKTPLLCTRLCPSGSPPRVRGKADLNSSQPFRLRITPACAGKSTELPV